MLVNYLADVNSAISHCMIFRQSKRQQMDGRTNKQTVRQTSGQIDRGIHGQTDRQIDNQTEDRETDRQTGRWKDGQALNKKMN